jgi:4-hydroxybenzoate polyprenyltransferase
MHIFEFVLNEYIDLEVDKRSPDLAEKPLVSGTVTPQTALGVVYISLIFSYILSIAFFFDIWSLIMLSLSFVFGAIYDIYGKRFAGSDFTLALWIFFFCLFGASIQSIDFTGVLYLVAGLGFFQILFNNAIEGGLKDADHDAAAGAKTLAHTLGVRVYGKKLSIPKTFKVSSYSIKIAHIFLILLLIYIGIIKIKDIIDIVQIILIILLISLVLFTLHRFLSFQIFRRDKLKRIFSVHEIATYYMAPIILLQLIGLYAVIFLLLLPLFWYMGLNMILYGRPLEPRV